MFPSDLGRECYHCKQWIPTGQAHDCWTTTESALTRDLSEDLREAWERLRETAADFGEQRIYASHNSIMFSRRSCYFFVRPKRSFLEVWFFLGRAVKSPLIKRADQTSRTKVAHLIQVRHRDQVEAPLTEWLREAYEWVPPVKTSTAVKAQSKSKPSPAKVPPKPQAKPTSKTKLQRPKPQSKSKKR